MNTSDAKRLNVLERGNTRLIRLVTYLLYLYCGDTIDYHSIMDNTNACSLHWYSLKSMAVKFPFLKLGMARVSCP
jgi:hypothetical protein